MRSRLVVVVAALSASLVSGGWLLERGLAGHREGGSARLFDAVISRVALQFVDSIPADSLYAWAAVGLIAELHDPHSAYLGAERLARLTETTSGGYVGLGVQVDATDEGIVVVEPMPGSPAEHAGLQAGDRLARINGHPTTGWTLEEARRALRGRVGTMVSLTVVRSGVPTPLSMTVARSDIHVHSVRFASMVARDVGYVDITIFSDSTAEELAAAIMQLRRQTPALRTLLVDLRNNPGGVLEQGVQVSELFLDPPQPIVTMRGRDSAMTHQFVDRARQRWPELGIVALVNGKTASASEIVAGALQDHDRGVILGTTTYGKGSAQTLFDRDEGGDALAGGGAVKLTTAKWFTPSGRSISSPRGSRIDDDGDGLAPDAGAAPRARPSFRTDAGRTVYGGGGIAPDVTVPEDSSNDLRALQRRLGVDVLRFRDALTQVAISDRWGRRVLAPDFAVSAAMKEALWLGLEKRHVSLTRQAYDSAGPAIARQIGYQIARYAIGPDAEIRRRIGDDNIIAAAAELATGASTSAELLRRASQRRARRDSSSARR
ncbi:MAG: S41 family peptidase [Gemmatimonadota bacterium]|nr:S41 family peptidase [Gemmatimonadota bacterium]